MIHVPQAMQQMARQWVATHQEAWRLTEQVSEHCLKRFLLKKEQLKGRRL